MIELRRDAAESKSFVVACIPAYNEERTIGGVVVRALRFVDRVVICDDGSWVPRGGDCWGRRLCGLSGARAMYIFGVIQFI